MLNIRSLSLVALALLIFVGCSGSSGGGNSHVYAIKDPQVGDPVVVGMEVGKTIHELAVVDKSTLFESGTDYFNFIPEKGAAFDSVNNAIVTFVDTDFGETLVSIDVKTGKVTKFSGITYPGEWVVAFYTTSSALKALLQNGEGDLRIVTISLSTKNEIGTPLPLTIDLEAQAIAGPPRHDNYIVDKAANKIYFLGDNGVELHLFSIDMQSGILAAVSDALAYDLYYSCMYNDGENASIVVENGVNNIMLLSINKTSGAQSTVAIDTAAVKNSTDSISFPNDYLHAESSSYVYGSSIISTNDLSSVKDNVFSLNKTTRELTILDSVVGCYYALVFAP